MTESELARVLLIRACEETDPDGDLLSQRERERASRLAGERVGLDADHPEGFLLARAGLLLAAVETRWPGVRRAQSLTTSPLPAGVVVALAFLGGLVLDRLGTTRRISLLAFPLLGLIVWNFAVYTAALYAEWRRWIGGRRRGAERAPGRAARTLSGVTAWLASPDRLWVRGRVAGAAPRRAALQRFARLWLAETGGLLNARVLGALHAGAAGFALGALAGMYIRGLAFEYRANWESTFLDAEAVRTLLSLVLGPAAWILHAIAPDLAASPERLFSPEMISSLQGPEGDGAAAVWIHLWAMTTVLVVVGPRLVLAAAEAHRAAVLSARLAPSLEEPYFLRVLSPWRGEGAAVELLPYSYRPSPRVQSRLRDLALDLFGNRASVRRAEPLAYGGTLADEPGPAAISPTRIVVFNLAQSPEEEVHGRLLDDLRRAAREGGGLLLVVLDDEAYRARMGDDPARLAERQRAWERLAREAGLSAVALGGGSDDELLAAARAGLWPAAAERAG